MLLGIGNEQKRHGRVVGRVIRFGVTAMLFALLTACTDSSINDLQSYVRSVKSRPAARIPPLPEFKMYETFAYTANDLRDPFMLFEDEAEFVAVDALAHSGPRPDQNRNKETLEQYPLDTLRFVGQLEKDSEQWAIITSPDKLVHRVKEGNFIGKNYGRITVVTETEIAVSELVPDGMGGWIEREAALSLGN